MGIIYNVTMVKLSGGSIFLTLIFCSVCYSAQKAHIHGLSNLNMVLDKQTLAIKIITPLGDIVGFEGIPRTKIQKESIEKAVEKFRKSENVLLINGGSCLQKKVTVNLGHIDETDNSRHKHNHKNHEDTHSDLSAEYEFNCSQPEHLKEITLRLFDQFSSMEKIKAQWITSNSQGQTSLTKNRNVIKIK